MKTNQSGVWGGTVERAFFGVERDVGGHLRQGVGGQQGAVPVKNKQSGAMGESHAVVAIGFAGVEDVDTFVRNGHIPESMNVVSVVGHAFFRVFSLNVHVGIVIAVAPDEGDGVPLEAADVDLSAPDVGTDESFLVRSQPQDGAGPEFTGRLGGEVRVVRMGGVVDEIVHRTVRKGVVAVAPLLVETRGEDEIGTLHHGEVGEGDAVHGEGSQRGFTDGGGGVAMELSGVAIERREFALRIHVEVAHHVGFVWTVAQEQPGANGARREVYQGHVMQCLQVAHGERGALFRDTGGGRDAVGREVGHGDDGYFLFGGLQFRRNR